MFYQLRATLFFDTPIIPEDILQSLQTAWRHAKVVNPGQDNQELSIVELFKSYHDQDPHQPCELIFRKDNSPEH